MGAPAKCRRCGGAAWTRHGTHRRGEVKVQRYQCSTCGRIQLEDIKARGPAMSAAKAARVQRFFRALGHHLALGFAEATRVAAAAVSVHRTTAQRWIRDADLDELPTTPVLGQEGRAFLRDCLELHREGPLLIAEVLPDAPSPSDDFVTALLQAVPEVPFMMAAATFQAAAMRTGEVPSWVDCAVDYLLERHVLSPSRRLKALGLVQDVSDRMEVELPVHWWKSPVADRWRLRWSEPMVQEWLADRCGLGSDPYGYGSIPREPEWLLAWLLGQPAPEPIDDERLRWWVKRRYLDADATVPVLLARAGKEPLLPGGLRLWLVYQAPSLSALAVRKGKIYGRWTIQIEVAGPSFKMPVELRGFRESWSYPSYLEPSDGKLVIGTSLVTKHGLRIGR